MFNIVLRACFVISCLCFAACVSDEAPPVPSVGRTALHGSAALVAEHLLSITYNEPLLIESPSFQRYFKRLGRIELSDSVLVGSITKIVIDANGRLLVFDRQPGQIFLFAPDGEFLKELSVEPCDPGFEWRPSDVVFSPLGSIFIPQNGPRHVVFDSSGECDYITGNIRTSYSGNVFTADHEIYTFVRTRDGHFINHYDRDGEVIRKIGESDHQRNFLNRISAMNLLQDATGRLFRLLPTSPLIQVYDSAGVDLGTIGSVPDMYRMYGDDIPGGLRGSDMVKAMNAIMREHSVSPYMVLLDEDLLLVYSTNGFEDRETSDRGSMLQIISTSGVVLTPEPIYMGPVKLYIAGARDGLLYFTTVPETDENGDWGNQGLEVYQFIR